MSKDKKDKEYQKWLDLVSSESDDDPGTKEQLKRLKAKRAALKKLKNKPFLTFEDVIPGLKRWKEENSSQNKEKK